MPQSYPESLKYSSIGTTTSSSVDTKPLIAESNPPKSKPGKLLKLPARVKPIPLTNGSLLDSGSSSNSDKIRLDENVNYLSQSSIAYTKPYIVPSTPSCCVFNNCRPSSQPQASNPYRDPKDKDRRSVREYDIPDSGVATSAVTKQAEVVNRSASQLQPSATTQSYSSVFQVPPRQQDLIRTNDPYGSKGQAAWVKPKLSKMYGSWVIAPSMLSPIMDVSPSVEQSESEDLNSFGHRRSLGSYRSHKGTHTLDSESDSSEFENNAAAGAESGFTCQLKRSPAMFLDSKNWEKYAHVNLRRDGLGQYSPDFSDLYDISDQGNKGNCCSNSSTISQQHSSDCTKAHKKDDGQPVQKFLLCDHLNSPPRETKSASGSPRLSPSSLRGVSSSPCSPPRYIKPQPHRDGLFYGSENSIQNAFLNPTSRKMNGRVPLILSHILLKEELKEALKLQRTKLQDIEIEAEERNNKVWKMLNTHRRNRSFETRKSSFPLCNGVGSVDLDTTRCNSFPDISISLNYNLGMSPPCKCSKNIATQTAPVPPAPEVSPRKAHRSNSRSTNRTKHAQNNSDYWSETSERKSVATNTHLTCRSSLRSFSKKPRRGSSGKPIQSDASNTRSRSSDSETNESKRQRIRRESERRRRNLLHLENEQCDANQMVPSHSGYGEACDNINVSYCPRFLRHHRSVSMSPDRGMLGDYMTGANNLFSTRSLGTLPNQSPRSSITGLARVLPRKANSDFIYSNGSRVLNSHVYQSEKAPTYYNRKAQYSSHSAWKI